MAASNIQPVNKSNAQNSMQSQHKPQSATSPDERGGGSGRSHKEPEKKKKIILTGAESGGVTYGPEGKLPGRLKSNFDIDV